MKRLGLALCLAATPAWADPPPAPAEAPVEPAAEARAEGRTGPRAEIADFVHKAGAFEAADTRGRLAEEISTLRDWVLEAQRNLKDPEALDESLARVRAQAALIEALLARSAAEATVRALRTEAEAIEKEAIELRRQAAEAEQARDILEQREAAQRGSAP